MEFRILGQTEVLVDGQVVNVGGPRTRAVLAMLLIRANEVVPADLLAEELWPKLPPERAAANLQVRLSELRGALRAEGEGERLLTRPPGYVLRASADEIDAASFEALVPQGRAALVAGDAPLALGRLEAALALWRGPALAGAFDVPGVSVEAMRLEEARLAAVELRVEARLACGEDAELAADLAALTEAHPLRERLWRQRMLALYRAGRQVEALRCYQELRRTLVDELGIEPGPETRELEARILRQDPDLGRRASAHEAGSQHPGGAGPATPAPPATQYALSGDVHIAYQVVGGGGLDILVTPGVISHLDLWWEDPGASRFFRRLASLGRLIMFDKRDTGLSDRSSRDHSLEQRIDDLRAVMDACGSRRAALFGYSEGGTMSLRFTATYPERVSALVLAATAARWSSAPDYPCRLESDTALGAFEALAHSGWGTGASIEWLAPSLAGSARVRERIARWERMAASPSALLRMLRLVRAIDVRATLPAIQVPTLVISRLDDRAAPPCHGRYLADRLAGSRYFEQPGGHLLWMGDTDAIFDEVEGLLTGTSQHPVRDRVLSTLVVADSGDQDLCSDAFTGAARETVAAHRGRMFRSGDHALLATFDGPTRAIRCADALRERAARLGIALGLGVHSGEIDIRNDGIGGTLVDTTACLASLAEPGEVLASGTVKDLVVGSGISFGHRGNHALSGVSHPSPLFNVLDT
ncbi:MAG TPA: alpha/beta fold hydrolase [Myxococcaceae bacterium]|nr:alpha/beta fold hydrolase [Myxococcaceae bacterium]